MLVVGFLNLHRVRVCVCVCVCLHTYNTYITCACIAIVHVLIMAIRYIHLFMAAYTSLFSPTSPLLAACLALDGCRRQKLQVGSDREGRGVV